MLHIYIKKFLRICGYFSRSCMLSTLINELTCGHWTTVVFIELLVYIELTKKLICTCSPTLVLTKGTKAHQRKVSSARLIVYTAHFIRAGLDFQDRVPVLSVLGLPLDMVRARVKFWSGTDGPKSFTWLNLSVPNQFFWYAYFFHPSRAKNFRPCKWGLKAALACKIFDTMISAILTYNIEILGVYTKPDFKTWDVSQIEKLNLQFCKRYLEVNNKASNIACRSELGLFPQSIKKFSNTFCIYCTV